MKVIKRILLRIIYCFPAFLRESFYNCYDFFAYPDLREKKLHYGTLNEDKTFYVIRPYNNSNEGLMSLLLNVFRQIVYAEEKGYTPVVDFKNYKTQYSDETNTNIWENYFEQLSPYSLDEVYSSKNVVLSGLKPTRKGLFEPYNRFNDDEVQIAKTIVKKYIRLNGRVTKELEKEAAQIKPEQCIGIYMRGTDYLSTKPIGHAKQPTVEQMRRFLDSNYDNEDSFYLVTEDQSIYNGLFDIYKDRIRIASFDKFISGYKESKYLFQSKKLNEISDSKYERGLYYLIKIVMLSKCSSIVGGNTCGSWAAVAFSKDETNYSIFKLGNY